MLAEVERTPNRIAEVRQEIGSLCAPYHAFDVVFSTWGTFGVARPDTLRAHGEGATGTAEYVAHVLLARPDPAPIRDASPDDLRRGVDLKRLGQLVGSVIMGLPMWFSYRQAGGRHEIDAELELRTRLYAHRLTIPSLSYEWDERATLLELFAPYDEQLREGLGFDADQALALCGSLGHLPMERATEFAADARGQARALHERVLAYRDGAPADDELIEALAALPPNESEEHARYMAMSYLAAHVGQRAAFTAGELADHAGVDEATAEAFLRKFRVDFGQRADAQLWREAPDRAVGGEMDVMRARPVLHHRGLHLPAAVDSVFFGLRDAFTDALKPTKRFSKYDRNRARTLENRALVALSQALDADWAHGSVKFRMRGADGEMQEGEADGVLRADSLVVLVESKAGSLSERAEHRPERLERGLKDLIVAAHEQHRASHRALIEGHATAVTDRSGKPLSLDLEGVTRVLRVAVNLENLASISPAVWQLQSIGLLPDDERAPWVVGIHELELICELIDRPSQLVHYMLRRLRINRQRVWAIDEMDFFMRYLDRGLWFEDDEVRGKFVDLGNHTDPLDAYMLGVKGIGPGAPRPTQRLDAETKQLIDEIEATGAPGRLEAQVMLLEGSSEAREQISNGLLEVRELTRTDGRRHDRTTVFGTDFAVTVCAVPPGDADDLAALLASYGQAKLRQFRLARWLGLAAIAPGDDPLAAMVLLTDPVRLEQAA